METVVHQLVQLKLSTFVKAVQASADTMGQRFVETVRLRAAKLVMMETQLTVINVLRNAKSKLQKANSETLPLKVQSAQTLTTC